MPNVFRYGDGFPVVDGVLFVVHRTRVSKGRFRGNSVGIKYVLPQRVFLTLVSGGYTAKNVYFQSVCPHALL